MLSQESHHTCTTHAHSLTLCFCYPLDVQALLERVADRLHPVGGYWTLRQRGEKEVQQMTDIWQNYLREFAVHAPELLGRPGIMQLASRLQRVSSWISEQMSADPRGTFATLIHGDFKAMNVFLPLGDLDEEAAVPIDFQWMGVGFGMSDVAMHLSHSVAASALQNGGEAKLVEHYRQVLLPMLSPQSAAEYSADVAWRHYRLGMLDWARMVFSVFFKDASPQAFAKRTDNPNVGLVYRDLQASLDFVVRVDKCLAEFERELSTRHDRALGSRFRSRSRDALRPSGCHASLDSLS